jgi:predicted Zn-dependent protease
MKIFARTILLFALLFSCLGIFDRAEALKFGDMFDYKTLEQATQALQGSGGVPLVGDPADADEEALGREVAGRLLAAAPLVNDPALQKYVNQVGVYVAQQSSRPQLNWTFGVIASDDINAFAAPGGYIFLTSGLYRMLQNEAELASILGHEITHVNLRHHVKLLQKTRLLAKGKDLLAKGQSATVQELAGTGAELYARSLDKEAEFACDRFGIEYAARAGYEPFAYIDALDRIGASDRSDQLALLFKTHPHPADRIDALTQSIGDRWDSLGGVTPQRWVKLAAGK